MKKVALLRMGLLVIGYWLLVIGYWLLVIGCWLLVVGCWLLVRRRICGSAFSKVATQKTARMFLTQER